MSLQKSKTKLIVIIFSLIMFHADLSLAQAEKPAPFLQTLESHKPIYLAQSWFLNDEGSDQGYRNDELIIQFSFKKNLFYDLYFGYTQKSFWQLWDHDNSRSFREQNYDPEFFYDLEDLWEIDLLRLGLWEHESNGDKERINENNEAVNYSRTWNRSYLTIREHFLDGFLGLGLKIWRVNDREDNEYGSFYDDNPGIQQYFGSGEVYIDMGTGPEKISLMLRKGWKSKTETVRLEAFLPFSYIGIPLKGTDLYFQYFNGYGESLIDYNRRVRRFAIGFSVR